MMDDHQIPGVILNTCSERCSRSTLPLLEIREHGETEGDGDI